MFYLAGVDVPQSVRFQMFFNIWVFWGVGFETSLQNMWRVFSPRKTHGVIIKQLWRDPHLTPRWTPIAPMPCNRVQVLDRCLHLCRHNRCGRRIAWHAQWPPMAYPCRPVPAWRRWRCHKVWGVMRFTPFHHFHPTNQKNDMSPEKGSFFNKEKIVFQSIIFFEGKSVKLGKEWGKVKIDENWKRDV